MKMRSTKQGWLILDKGVLKLFENSTDAWMYVLLMKEVRPHTTVVPNLYPVRTLDPRPFSIVKKVTIFT